MSADALHQQFIAIITRFPQGRNHPERLQGILADECFAVDEPWRKNFLVELCRISIESRLLNNASDVDSICRRAIMVLQDRHACYPESAAWAVEAWRLAANVGDSPVWPLPKAFGLASSAPQAGAHRCFCCQLELEPDDAYCPRCGSKQACSDPNCGHTVLVADCFFCPKCGKALVANPVPTGPAVSLIGKNCYSCRGELSLGEYCPHCGLKQECPNPDCRNTVFLPGCNFCPQCGLNLSASSTGATVIPTGNTTPATATSAPSSPVAPTKTTNPSAQHSQYRQVPPNQPASPHRSMSPSQPTPHQLLQALNVGDTFTFGNYPQGPNGELQPIEWQVLRQENDGLLVIAKHALDCQCYNPQAWVTVNWSQCSLRHWLNDDFINAAFDSADRSRIIEVSLQNLRSKIDYHVSGGPDTYDKIFLLSHDEVEKYFLGEYARCCKPTAYAKAQGVTVDNAFGKYRGHCDWWLRSPGDGYGQTANVSVAGNIKSNFASNDNIAVRPVCKIAY